MICRLCLKEPECCLEIFDLNGEQLGIADILKTHFWFQPLPTDEISTVICIKCWLKVSNFHEFYLMVEQAHSILSNTEVNNETINIVVDKNYAHLTKEIKAEISDGQGLSEVVEETIKTLYESQFDNTHTDESDERQATSEMMQETINSLYEEELLFKHDADDDDDDAVSDETIGSKNDTRATRKCVPAPDVGETINSLYEEELLFKHDADDDDDDDDDGDDDDDDDDAVSDETIGSKNDTSAKRKCVPATARRTYKEQQKSEADQDEVSSGEDDDNVDVDRPQAFNSTIEEYYDDFVAERVFKSPFEDNAMMKTHIDMACDLCTFVGDDYASLLKHFRLYHAKIKPYVRCCEKKYLLNQRYRVLQHAYWHYDPEYFKCKICQKNFRNLYSLNTHILSKHAPEEELKFPCDQCTKKFSRKHLLSSHIVKTHRTKYRYSKDSGPRFKCPRPNCDHYLQNEMGLTAHLRRHNKEKLEFKCNECGQHNGSQSLLQKHKKECVHSNA